MLSGHRNDNGPSTGLVGESVATYAMSRVPVVGVPMMNEGEDGKEREGDPGRVSARRLRTLRDMTPVVGMVFLLVLVGLSRTGPIAPPPPPVGGPETSVVLSSLPGHRVVVNGTYGPGAVVAGVYLDVVWANGTNRTSPIAWTATSSESWSSVVPIPTDSVSMGASFSVAYRGTWYFSGWTYVEVGP